MHNVGLKVRHFAQNSLKHLQPPPSAAATAAAGHRRCRPPPLLAGACIANHHCRYPAYTRFSLVRVTSTCWLNLGVSTE
ncbi:hypothetical protein HanRHA438_Chr06g0271681 [Helianthus annuus]|uniref:Uncharacterized protein n=1 Tax=Helianthus annuus TaxID=4232 RepID=A0A9K3NKA7_HELAN|nr:hypothetical protein HanXRQr2_Chr06g0262441 [Helianthus annuus]KAJ0560786.1 hypothetical protein HanHA300_Chr06g0215281 [Helianthus annuus]KAJ0567212.1 hypothetical protein HanIR_Chr06g0282201 [Helianthus annuus]KAJ0573822.1 hypothetical protein HanHA89_Chr06g0231051 [Helianthus annuus]KAJ0738157.1 hypothetical protein HanLR1_Chr06g0214981 [Helianthus annuus]